MLHELSRRVIKQAPLTALCISLAGCATEYRERSLPVPGNALTPTTFAQLGVKASALYPNTSGMLRGVPIRSMDLLFERNGNFLLTGCKYDLVGPGGTQWAESKFFCQPHCISNAPVLIRLEGENFPQVEKGRFTIEEIPADGSSSNRVASIEL